MENEFTSVLLFISITFTLTRATLQKKFYQMNIILHKLAWRHGTRSVSGLRRRYLASVSPGGGAGEGREGTATRRLVVAMFNHALTEKWTIGNVPINAPHPNINMHIIHTVLYTFPRVLTRGTCLTIKTSSSWWLFPLFTKRLIPGRYSKRRSDVSHSQGSKN